MVHDPLHQNSLDAEAKARRLALVGAVLSKNKFARLCGYTSWHGSAEKTADELAKYGLVEEHDKEISLTGIALRISRRPSVALSQFVATSHPRLRELWDCGIKARNLDLADLDSKEREIFLSASRLCGFCSSEGLWFPERIEPFLQNRESLLRECTDEDADESSQPITESSVEPANETWAINFSDPEICFEILGGELGEFPFATFKAFIKGKPERPGKASIASSAWRATFPLPLDANRQAFVLELLEGVWRDAGR